MDMNFDFASADDFGLAKNFSPAPTMMITPEVKHEEFTNYETDSQFQMGDDEIRSDGFCFKMAPVENVRDPEFAINQV
jgi:hypothetical protein